MDLELLYYLLGLCLFLVCCVVLGLITVNVIHWLCMKRDELKVQRAHAKFQIERWKREGRIYEKYLK